MTNHFWLNQNETKKSKFLFFQMMPKQRTFKKKKWCKKCFIFFFNWCHTFSLITDNNWPKTDSTFFVFLYAFQDLIKYFDIYINSWLTCLFTIKAKLKLNKHDWFVILFKKGNVLFLLNLKSRSSLDLQSERVQVINEPEKTDFDIIKISLTCLASD